MTENRLHVRGSLLNLREAEDASLEGATVGKAEIVLAAYGIPDTNKPVGVAERQVIDYGAFRSFAQSRDFGVQSVPHYLDHGGAIQNKGYPDSRLKLGRSVSFRESDAPEHSGLISETLYNLRKEVSRDAYSDLLFDPLGEQFSFRWDHDETYRGSDSFEHVSKINEVLETSQVGALGAQAATGVIEDSLAYRMAMRSHTTETVEGDWDEEKALRSLSADPNEGLFRRAFAWMRADGDPESVASYGFIHHGVEDARVGSANVTACRAGIAALNEGTDLADSERRAVYNHLRSHLTDAGISDIEPLKARMPRREQLMAWAAEDAGFRQMLGEIFPPTRVGVVEIKAPEILEYLKGDPEARQALRAALDEIDKPSVLDDWYRDRNQSVASVWSRRAKVSN